MRVQLDVGGLVLRQEMDGTGWFHCWGRPEVVMVLRKLCYREHLVKNLAKFSLRKCFSSFLDSLCYFSWIWVSVSLHVLYSQAVWWSC